MKQLINLGLLISFLFCYLEWPPNNSMFVFQVEYEVFSNTKDWFSNFTHPIILVGFIAQLLIIYSALNKKVNHKLNTVGILLLAPIVLLFFIVGLLSLNVKIILSTLPFLLFLVFYFYWYKKNTKKTTS